MNCKQDKKEFEWLLREGFGGEKSEAFFSAARRLALGEPLSYIIGWVNFLNCKIFLDSKPLIPRTETEYWTEKAIDSIKKYISSNTAKTVKVLDLCAGSGCIGIAVAKNISGASVDFSEIDKKHVPLIKNNLIANKLPVENYTIHNSDLFNNCRTVKYDFILVNPPYIQEHFNHASDNVKKYEPYIALFGGNEGMEVIIKIIRHAAAFMKPQGQLWLEHDPHQSAKIKHLARKNNFRHCHHYKDQYGIERYSVLML